MAGVRELARIFELIAKLTGQLDQGTRVNVLVAQQRAEEAEQELMLERSTVAERLELRRLVAKAQSESGDAPVGISVATNGVVVEVDGGGAQVLARSD